MVKNKVARFFMDHGVYSLVISFVIESVSSHFVSTSDYFYGCSAKRVRWAIKFGTTFGSYA